MDTVSRDVLEMVARGRHGRPDEVLGPHRLESGEWLVRAFLPGVARATVTSGGERYACTWVHGDGVLEARLPAAEKAPAYRIRLEDADGRTTEIDDPYAFAPELTSADFAEFRAGSDFTAYRRLGAHPTTRDGVVGTRFSVWAPNAIRVSVIGSFNDWNGRRHPMIAIEGAGVWELFVPGAEPGNGYKFEIRSRDGGRKSIKSDPFAFASEVERGTASVVFRAGDFDWSDADWLAERGDRQAINRPLSIYEVHAGSWRRDPADDGPGDWLSWSELAERLIPYVKELGFTHLELMPVMEHPFDGSWGYQVTGYFAATSRFGTPDDLRAFIDAAHAAGLGVLLDWVPAHFPRDGHGLGYFDGTHLFEPSDPKMAVHPDWKTFEFDYSRPEVRSFLLSSAHYWVKEFHADGLRVDAVASMLYLDYSRPAGEWTPNEKGGRENLHAVRLLRDLNETMRTEAPSALIMAEESTSWPGVTRPVAENGLGFSRKWNLGWMNDWLAFLRIHPDHRGPHLTNLTFGLTYAFAERFLLPLSHDEVVHGKGSLWNKMPGTDAQKTANLRLLLGGMIAHPGGKLLFMGAEHAQRSEWNHDTELEWSREDEDEARALRAYLRALLRLYREEPALHACDDSWDGFEWIVPDDRKRCVLAFVRRAGAEQILVAMNLSAFDQPELRFGVPTSSAWTLVLDSSAIGPAGAVAQEKERVLTEEEPAHDREQSAVFSLPSLTIRYWKAESTTESRKAELPSPPDPPSPAPSPDPSDEA